MLNNARYAPKATEMLQCRKRSEVPEGEMGFAPLIAL
jgi:hypothetical protein